MILPDPAQKNACKTVCCWCAPYMRAQDIVDAALYPHCAAHGGWCDDDFEDALQGLYECALLSIGITNAAGSTI